MNDLSPYVEFSRALWKELGHNTPSPLSENEVALLRGLDTPLDLDEVEDIYIPLSRLIYLRFQAQRDLYRRTSEFFGAQSAQVPFIVAIAGSVAVGKSTTARVLQSLLSRWDEKPKVELVTTDGFLRPTAELQKMGLLERKGFPESYNLRSLLRFVSELKSGKSPVTAPVYSHVKYDIIPEKFFEVHHPDILILEGLNVLQTGRQLMVSDFFDFSIYVDAQVEHLLQWYVSRFLSMRSVGFAHPESPFFAYSHLNDEEATEIATEVWNTINLPNLLQNIAPTRPRADLVLRKGSSHLVESIRMRKI